MRTVAILQARMGSTRLPGKVLMDLDGIRPVMGWAYHTAVSAVGVDDVVIATTTNPIDDVIVKRFGADICVRGSETDVLSRFVLAAEKTKADIILRITGDCPFLDANVIADVVRLRQTTGADYASCIDPPTYPDGLDVECFTREALMVAHGEASRAVDRDCVTSFIRRNRDRFSAANLVCPVPGLIKERWVLDTQDDLRFCQEIAGRLRGWSPTYQRILAILDENPELRKINSHHPRNERYFEALASEDSVGRSYSTSRRMLVGAEAVIPLGTQTYSKSKIQYPEQAPLFVTHGRGGLVYDVDGNEFVDCVSGLLPNVLGYCDDDVDTAIRKQLNEGISFSLATKLEADLAERLYKIIPCAEMARFGKNGTDVTTAAVRLARAYTERDKILSSGYHGWADWSLAHDNVRNLGIPESVQNLTTVLAHGDYEAAQKELATRQYAAVIVEPETDIRFLKVLRAACDDTNTVLIFDEIITGFRFHLGGAQSLYGIRPDLATFGKAMANGMPLSALVGRREIMRLMDRVCFSGTFMGEALSLAAGIATIDKMLREPVLEHIHNMNHKIIGVFYDLQKEHNLDCIQIAGDKLPRIKFFDTHGWFTKGDIKTLFMQNMIAQGVLIIASFNMCYAHTNNDLHRICRALEVTFGVMAQAIAVGDVQNAIFGRPLDATASIRGM